MQSRGNHRDHSIPAIRLIGPLMLERDGTPIGYGAKKGLALLACLSLRDGHFVPRDTAVSLLWADSGEDQARASLRQILSGLRKALGATAGESVLRDHAGFSLAQDLVDIDLTRFRTLARVGDHDALRQAAALCRGELLEGFPSVTPEFDRWLDAERSAVRAQVMVVLLRLCDADAASGDINAALAAAHQMIALDPMQEHVHRRLMRLYLQQKRHDAALRQFETLKALLQAELGVMPDPETLDLFKEVRRHRAAPVLPAVAPTRVVAPDLHMGRTTGPTAGPLTGLVTGRPSIAVLPFKGLTATEGTDLFGEAVAEEIIVELARETALMVVARGSSFQFDLEKADATDIGQRLGARFLLSGSAAIAGDKVRVMAHLVNCLTGREIWAERHDRALKDMFEIQTDIARTVTATVVGRIAEAEAEAAFHRPFESLESYSLAAQGYRHFLGYSSDSYLAAIGCFERAVALDPGFARAWGLLALAGIYQRWYFDTSTDVAEFVPMAETAIRLDPRDAKGHCALGVAHLLLRNFDKAGFHFDAGLGANPNDDLLLIEHGRYLMYVEQPEAGLVQVTEAMRINPLHPNWYWNIQGRCLHMMGRTSEALAAFQRIHSPNFWVHAYIAACHAALGHADAAQTARQDLLRLRPDFNLSDYLGSFPYRNEATARRFLAEMGLGV